jgi:hypothetical protein
MQTTARLAVALLGVVMLGGGCGGGGPLDTGDGGGRGGSHGDAGPGGGGGGGGSGGHGGSGGGGFGGDGGTTGTGGFTGTGGTGATCSSAPCGGNIVGTWALTPDCPLFLNPTPNALCPTETFDTSNYHLNETATFNADSTYSVTATVTGSLTIMEPAECLTDAQTCAAANAALQSEIATQGSIVSGGSCTSTASGGCQCIEQLNTASAASASGTYTTGGGTLIVTPTQSSQGTTGSPSTDQYCVAGNRLYVSDSSGTNWFVFARQ